MFIVYGILMALCTFILGMLCLPLVIFMRARRDGSWDDSNMTNMYRVFAHIATHPSDLALMVYPKSGIRPFWYINKDEFGEVVETRPTQEDKDYDSNADSNTDSN